MGTLTMSTRAKRRDYGVMVRAEPHPRRRATANLPRRMKADPPARENGLPANEEGWLPGIMLSWKDKETRMEAARSCRRSSPRPVEATLVIDLTEVKSASGPSSPSDSRIDPPELSLDYTGSISRADPGVLLAAPPPSGGQRGQAPAATLNGGQLGDNHNAPEGRHAPSAGVLEESGAAVREKAWRVEELRKGGNKPQLLAGLAGDPAVGVADVLVDMRPVGTGRSVAAGDSARRGRHGGSRASTDSKFPNGPPDAAPRIVDQDVRVGSSMTGKGGILAMVTRQLEQDDRWLELDEMTLLDRLRRRFTVKPTSPRASPGGGASESSEEDDSSDFDDPPLKRRRLCHILATQEDEVASLDEVAERELEEGGEPRIPTPVNEPAHSTASAVAKYPEEERTNQSCGGHASLVVPLCESPIRDKRRRGYKEYEIAVPTAAAMTCIAGVLCVWWNTGHSLAICRCPNCIRSCSPEGRPMSPPQFEAHGGKGSNRKWKQSVLVRERDGSWVPVERSMQLKYGLTLRAIWMELPDWERKRRLLWRRWRPE